LGHHGGTIDLHVVDDEFVSEERVLLVLTHEVHVWNEHIEHVLEDNVLFIGALVVNHLVWFVGSEFQLLQIGKFEHVS
jgi:hypothetical protein